MNDSFISKTNRVLDELSLKNSWTPQSIQDVDEIPKGDMPGDSIQIGPEHIKKSQVIFPRMLELVIPIIKENPYKRAVISLCGGSGVGNQR